MNDRLVAARRILIVGANGGIGRALTHRLLEKTNSDVLTASREPKPDLGTNHYEIDYDDDASMDGLATFVKDRGELDAAIITTGVLQNNQARPERSLRSVNRGALVHVLNANTVVPTLLLSTVAPLLTKAASSTLAVLSARVGSITDNRLGGWYSYRASKAALNMIVKTTAIELRRTHPKAVVVGLHPGTVDTDLSRPFQKNLPAGQLTKPEDAARHLLDVLNSRESADSGLCFDWRGDAIPP